MVSLIKSRNRHWRYKTLLITFLIHNLYCNYMDALWAPRCKMMSEAVWIFVCPANTCVTFCRNHSAMSWSTLKEEPFSPCCADFSDCVRTLRDSTQQRLFWPWNFCTVAALCTGRQVVLVFFLRSFVIEMTVNTCVLFVFSRVEHMWNIYTVGSCLGWFYDDSLLQPLSIWTEHSRLVVHHCHNWSILSVLSALLPLFQCASVSSFSILV